MKDLFDNYIIKDNFINQKEILNVLGGYGIRKVLNI